MTRVLTYLANTSVLEKLSLRHTFDLIARMGPRQENLRQLCVFKLANASGQPWQWWDYVTRFANECKMSEQKYNEECAEKVRRALAFQARC